MTGAGEHSHRDLRMRWSPDYSDKARLFKQSQILRTKKVDSRPEGYERDCVDDNLP